MDNHNHNNNNNPQQQQQQQQLTIENLEKTCSIILDNNFDVDTKICFVTLIKILDNIIQKPKDAKVRNINLSNPTFQSKVGSKVGSIDFLLACGFTYDNNNTNNNNQSSSLVLFESNENITHIITARRLLMTRCIQELNIPKEELPIYKSPPPPIQLVNVNDGKQQQGQQQVVDGASSFVFNPYVRHRFDVKNAMGGTSESTYISKTELEVQKLMEKQKQLEEQQNQQTISSTSTSNTTTTSNNSGGGWIAYRPNESIIPFTNNNNNDITTTTSSSSTTGGGSSGDSTLLMQRLKKQQENAKQSEMGFTTKAMRDLQRLKKQKVYSSVTLTIQFPDGYKLINSDDMKPKTTIGTIIQSIQQYCLMNSISSSSSSNNNNYDFDLYVTPPRRLLQINKTLQEEDLVPAAKLFVSWKTTKQPKSGISYIKEELFYSNNNNSSKKNASGPILQFPTGQALVDDDNQNTDRKMNADDDDKKKPAATTKAISREEALLQRMMGGSGSGGNRGLGSGGSDSSNNNSNNKKPSGNKPKWFK